ncbi:MAG: hypothetical protein ACK4NT_07845, partial [Candidatus Omnitrophota bacterium]
AGWGNFSQPYRFTFYTEVPRLSIVSPRDGATVYGFASWCFEWAVTNSVPVTEYEGEVYKKLSKKSKFPSSARETEEAFSGEFVGRFRSSFPHTGIAGLGGQTLVGGQTYLWRVRGKNDAGWGPWVSSSFRMGEPPPKPTLFEPSDRARISELPIKFVWQHFKDIEIVNYEFEISDKPDFSSLIYREQFFGGPIPPELDPYAEIKGEGLREGKCILYLSLFSPKTYYWRVYALNTLGRGPYSDIWSFTYRSSEGLPLPPLLISPQNDTFLTERRPRFKWNAIEGAKEYCIEVSEKEDFSSLVFRLFPKEAEVISPYNLNDGRYYWRVRAYNAIGEGDWSQHWSFNLDSSPPQININFPKE